MSTKQIDHQAAIQAAIQAAQQQRTAAEKAAQDAETRLAALAKQRSEMDATEERLRLARLQAVKDQKAAETAEKRAKMMIEPSGVTLKVATELARQVLENFEDEETVGRMEKRPASLSGDELWETVDEVRSRLLTQKVDPAARELTLGIEGVLHLCDRWEHHRAGHVRAELGSDGEGLGQDPRDCRAVKRMLRDLRQMLAGKAPAKTESIGELVSQGIHFGQIAKMLGLIQPTGDPDLGAIATLVDRGKATGPSWLAWRWLGHWNLENAWAARQSQVPVIRSKRADQVGGLAMGSHRAGRLSGVGVLAQRRIEQDEAEWDAADAAHRNRETQLAAQ